MPKKINVHLANDDDDALCSGRAPLFALLSRSHCDERFSDKMFSISSPFRAIKTLFSLLLSESLVALSLRDRINAQEVKNK